MPETSNPAGSSSILDDLWATIAERRAERPEGSYVVKLLDGGPAKAGEKVVEEAGELVEAAIDGTDVDHIVHEAADLVFHAWALLATTDAEPAAVYAELDRRFGTSGLAEKASRTTSSDEDETAE